MSQVRRLLAPFFSWLRFQFLPTAISIVLIALSQLITIVIPTTLIFLIAFIILTTAFQFVLQLLSPQSASATSIWLQLSISRRSQSIRTALRTLQGSIEIGIRRFARVVAVAMIS